MTSKNPEALRTTLAAAADCIHSANYQTLPHEGTPGLEHPADLYDALGNLRLLHQYEAQLLGQLSGWLVDECTAGRVAHDEGSDPGAAVLITRNALAEAASTLAMLDRYLGAAHNASAHLKAAD